MCIFLMEKYSLSPGMLAAAIPVTRNSLCTYIRGAPFLALLKVIIHHSMAQAVPVGICVPSTYMSQALSVFVIMCCHGFA